MLRAYLYYFFCFFTTFIFSQSPVQYTISFENAVHHEAIVKGVFKDLQKDTVSFRMSRTSPGRYALHEFAKNVYDVKMTDSEGNPLKIMRPDPYQWQVSGHNGIIYISYTLFADRGDGTYSQIDDTHAHLNIPATFMYVPELASRPIEVNFKVREDLQWKVATQLYPKAENMFTAPDLYYFMDSPVEISNHTIREFKDTSNGKEYTIRFVLHHPGTEEEFNTYFEKVKKIVVQEKKVFGEYPDFDTNTYTFLACYHPTVAGDGMEHRNSTILTDTESLANGGMENNIGTVAHEFFHAWNVERIRPKDLEPFDFENANMSEALWFAEGFTSYYTGLILHRAGIITTEEYLEKVAKTFNYVWNSPARNYFNPIEMSYQAPFVDAATSVDPVNKDNTFISYYSYGSILGLALDLSLRKEENNLTLDDFMKLIWATNGKNEIPYTVKDLHKTLEVYAGKAFADSFFEKYIYDSQMPDYQKLFDSVGILVEQKKSVPASGLTLKVKANNVYIDEYPLKNTAAYETQLDKDDVLLKVNETSIKNLEDWKTVHENHKPGDTLNITYRRNGNIAETKLLLAADPAYDIVLSKKADKKAVQKRKEWLSPD